MERQHGSRTAYAPAPRLSLVPPGGGTEHNGVTVLVEVEVSVVVTVVVVGIPGKLIVIAEVLLPSALRALVAGSSQCSQSACSCNRSGSFGDTEIRRAELCRWQWTMASRHLFTDGE